MRIVSVAMLAILAGAAAGVAGQSSMQSAPASQTQLAGVNVTGQRTPLPHYYVAPEQVHEISGAYLMSNNATAKISDRRSKLYVDFDGRVTELQAVGENLYVSRANDMSLQYKPESFGAGMVLTYVPRENMAQASPDRETLYASRER